MLQPANTSNKRYTGLKSRRGAGHSAETEPDGNCNGTPADYLGSLSAFTYLKDFVGVDEARAGAGHTADWAGRRSLLGEVVVSPTLHDEAAQLVADLVMPSP
jgi:hypothetical protein